MRSALEGTGRGSIGRIFGHLIDGTQAEYTRVPYAETSVHKVPEGITDQQVLFLTDILPTGYEVGVRYGGVKPGDVVEGYPVYRELGFRTIETWTHWVSGS